MTRMAELPSFEESRACPPASSAERTVTELLWSNPNKYGLFEACLKAAMASES